MKRKKSADPNKKFDDLNFIYIHIYIYNHFRILYISTSGVFFHQFIFQWVSDLKHLMWVSPHYTWQIWQMLHFWLDLTLKHHERMYMFTSAFLPHSPARNADCLDDADHHLRHEDEEESHEVEGAVGPARRERQESGVSDADQRSGAEDKASCQRGRAAHLKAL